jgi:chemotaxis protein methyltransferase CheR
MNPAEYLTEVIAQRTGLRREISRPKVDALLKAFSAEDAAAAVNRITGFLPASQEWADFIEPFLIHETYFFRHSSQLQFLAQTVLPSLLEEKQSAGKKQFRAWCAGCSSGEEAYSISLMIRDAISRFFGASAALWDVSVIGTDLSHAMILRARAGEYTLSSGLNSFRDVPEFARHHFMSILGGAEKIWKADDGLRRTTSFQQRNLVEDAPPLPEVDLILCRNILIYFDADTVRSVLKKLERTLRIGGVLMLGPADTLRETDEFEMLTDSRAIAWKKKGRFNV